jgi:hypothetical protein
MEAAVARDLRISWVELVPASRAEARRGLLPNGAPWICERCYPPGPPTDQVELVEVADA